MRHETYASPGCPWGVAFGRPNCRRIVLLLNQEAISVLGLYALRSCVATTRPSRSGLRIAILRFRRGLAALARQGARTNSGSTAGGKRIELENRWYREVFRVGRRAADQLNRAVWVYPLAAIDELRQMLEIELRGLQDGATDVLYHGEPFAFENYYDIYPTARAESPKPLLLK